MTPRGSYVVVITISDAEFTAQQKEQISATYRKKEKYSVDIGFILSDILTGLKKVAEHSLLVMDAVQSAKME